MCIFLYFPSESLYAMKYHFHELLYLRKPHSVYGCSKKWINSLWSNKYEARVSFQKDLSTITAENRDAEQRRVQKFDKRLIIVSKKASFCISNLQILRFSFLEAAWSAVSSYFPCLLSILIFLLSKICFTFSSLLSSTASNGSSKEMDKYFVKQIYMKPELAFRKTYPPLLLKTDMLNRSVFRNLTNV